MLSRPMFLLPLLAGLVWAGAPDAVKPALATPAKMRLEIRGVVGERLRLNLENWELRAPDANPAMTGMFYDRDRKPGRKLLPWSGEFVGKYLCSSILSYRILRDPRQKALIHRVVRELLESQDREGYLGPFDRASRLTGKNWDIWGHYWAIRALLLYHEEFGSAEALGAARRAANLLVEPFSGKDFHFTNDGSQGQMNYAVIHGMTELYRVTGEARYLEMARWIVKEWDLPGAGQYMSGALAGKEMFQFPGNRWESLHDFLGMADLYRLTGEAPFRDAFMRIWDSILKGDRHNTGGFTSGEKTTGNPYDGGAIETCCTVAWIDMSIAMLKLAGDPLVADELELSTLNGMIGGQSPSGRWWTYNTPMNGVKEASAHTINFQCRPGSPELNCCSVNGPRGMALLSEWAVLQSAHGFVVNYYGPSTFQVSTPRGQALKLVQETRYPAGGGVGLSVSMATPEKFALQLRIPAWSAQTKVRVNGTAVSDARPGSYLTLERTWKNGDNVALELDMSPHYWAGEREQKGQTSVYLGPLLMAFDPVYNAMDLGEVPELDAGSLKVEAAAPVKRSIQPWRMVTVRSTGGLAIQLCDFVTAGAYGNPYRTWLPIRNVAPRAFDRQRPVWAARP